MTPTHLVQPEYSYLCGQTCVAMVAGMTIEQSVLLFGHSKGTRTNELVCILQWLGYNCDTRLRVVGSKAQQIPERSILNIDFYVAGRKTPFGHWALFWDGVFYDPAGLGTKYPLNARVTSALNLVSSHFENCQIPEIPRQLDY